MSPRCTAAPPWPAPSPHRARALAVASLTAAAWWCGCARLGTGANPVASASVSEANLAGNPELGLSAEQARVALRSALEASGKFSFRDSGAQIRLEVEQARRVMGPEKQGQAERELAEVSISLELLPPNAQADGDRLVAEGLARKPTFAEVKLDPESRAEAFSSALKAALQEASVSLAYQLEARKKPDAELTRDLAADDPRLRDYAVRVLADRRNPAAVPSLIGRLHDDSPVVVLRAIGALTAIGDRRAVRPLIELSRRKPAPIVAQILYALGSLGGPEAESFLFTLESGSPDAEVRRAAAEAFADLRRKATEAAAREPAAHRPGGP